MSVSHRDVIRMRGRVCIGNNRLGPVQGRTRSPYQVVFKVLSKAKEPSYVAKIASYIARIRPEDRLSGAYGSVEIRDGYGNSVDSEDVVGHIYQWPMNRPGENQVYSSSSPRHHLPLKERLWKNQAAHLSWSVNGSQEPPGPLTTSRLEIATLSVLDDVLGSRGFPSIWGIHTEHPVSGYDTRYEPENRFQPEIARHDRKRAVAWEDDRVEEGGSTDKPQRPYPVHDVHSHVHILVPFQGAEGRLEVDRDFIDLFRYALQIRGREAGLNLVAERREDREEVRNKILNGKEPLRHFWKKSKQARRLADIGTWYDKHGAAMEKRLKKINAIRDKAKARGADPEQGLADSLDKQVPRFTIIGRKKRIPSGLERLAQTLSQSFFDPVQAIKAYQDLAWSEAYRSESGVWQLPNKKKADWYMRHKPVVFGDIRSNSLRHAHDPNLINDLRALYPEARKAFFEPNPEDRKRRNSEKNINTSRETRNLVAALAELGIAVDTYVGDKDMSEQVRSIQAIISRQAPDQQTRVSADRRFGRQDRSRKRDKDMGY